MVTLAVDTCDTRGSVALHVGRQCRTEARHEEGEYSSWLLPAVDEILRGAGVAWPEVELVGVATGPGSFTGVRVGLTAAKAWAEVYGVKLAGVSRLEAMGRAGRERAWVAASYDAHRGQVFGALYRREGDAMTIVEAGVVATAEELVALVNEKAKDDGVEWVTLDAKVLREAENWNERAGFGDLVTEWTGGLANRIGEMADACARRGQYTDAMALDANYVRRSDAEIFWKGPAHVG